MYYDGIGYRNYILLFERTTQISFYSYICKLGKHAGSVV